MSTQRKMILAVAAGLMLGGVMPAMTGGAAAAPAAVVVANAADIDQLLAAVASYKVGDSRKGLEAVAEQVAAAQVVPAQRALVAGKLAGLVDNTVATYEARDFAFRQLYVIGTVAEVPTLAKYLPDEQFSHMARYVLERIEDPAAGAALRQALSTTKGQLLLGVINSIGERGDAQAVPALAGLLAGADVAVASAAASSLGKIGGADALKALLTQKNASDQEVKAVVADACLCCADDMLKAGKKAEAAVVFDELRAETQPVRVRIAALRGLTLADPAKALPLLIDALKGDDAVMQAMGGAFTRLLPAADTKALATALPALNANGQIHLINAMAARQDAAAKPAVTAALSNADPIVRLAAIGAVGALGDASDIVALIDLAAKAKTTAQTDAARDAIAHVRGANVDAALIGALASSTPETKTEMIRALASRRANDAATALLVIAAKDDAEAVRIAALNALGVLASDKDFPVLVDRVAGAKSDQEREAARSAVAAISGRMSNPDASSAPLIAALTTAQPAGKVALVSTLSRIAGAKALDAVRAAMNDADAAVKEAATRGITQWPDAAATDEMLTLVRSDNQTYKVLALRGLLRVTALPGKRPSAQTLGVYKQMMDACTRPEDKKIVLAGLADVKDAGALNLVTPCLDDAALANEAAAAAIKIAKAVGAGKAPAKAALQKVGTAKVSDNLKKQAEAALAGK